MNECLIRIFLTHSGSRSVAFKAICVLNVEFAQNFFNLFSRISSFMSSHIYWIICNLCSRSIANWPLYQWLLFAFSSIHSRLSTKRTLGSVISTLNIFGTFHPNYFQVSNWKLFIFTQNVHLLLEFTRYLFFIINRICNMEIVQKKKWKSSCINYHVG